MSIMWTIAEQALRNQMTATTQAVYAAPPRFGMYAAAGLLCVAGMAFSLAAIYMGLSASVPPATAALGTAATAFAAAGGLIGIVQLRRLLHKKRMARLPAVDNINMDAINDALQMILEEFEEPVKAYPKTAMALAALAGLVAGKRIH